MSSETVVDPRSEVTHILEEGQVYETARTGAELVLVFLSEDVALLQDEDGDHRLEPRDMFEAYVGSGYYDLQSDPEEATRSSAKLQKLERLKSQYEEQGGRKASHKVSALEEAIELIEHNGRPDDNEMVAFEEIGGIGAKAADALRNSGFSTKGDVRDAEREDIIEVPYMGEKNTDNLIEHVE